MSVLKILKNVTSGAEARMFCGLNVTAEAVTYPKPFMKPNPGDRLHVPDIFVRVSVLKGDSSPSQRALRVGMTRWGFNRVWTVADGCEMASRNAGHGKEEQPVTRVGHPSPEENPHRA